MSKKNLILNKLTESAQNNIADVINDLKKMKLMNHIKIFESDFDISKYKIDNLQMYQSISYDLAKLSIGLYLDFDYFRLFQFKGKYDDSIYVNRLEILGYKQVNGCWKYGLDCKPDHNVIVDNLFIYHCVVNFLELQNLKLSSTIDPQEEMKESHVSTKIDELQKKELKKILVNDDRYSPVTPTYKTNNDSSDSSSSSDVDKEYKTKRDDTFHEPPAVIQDQLVEKNNTNSDDKSNLEESWTCSNCTFSNSNSITNCQMCYQLKTLLSENLHSDNNNNNDPSSIHNEDNNSKVILNDTKDNIDNYLSCNACTFKNEPDNLNCEVCKEDLLTTESIKSETQDKEVPCSYASLDKSSGINSINKSDNFENEKAQISMKRSLSTEKNDENIHEEGVHLNVKTQNLKDCFHCTQKKVDGDFKLCPECSQINTVCVNRACTELLKLDAKKCPKCGVKKDSDLSNANTVQVWKLMSYADKWQCGFCFNLNSVMKYKCKKCENTRESFVKNPEFLNDGQSFSFWRKMKHHEVWQCTVCFQMVSIKKTQCDKCGFIRKSHEQKLV